MPANKGIYLFILLSTFVQTFRQSDYKFTLEHIEDGGFDSKYFYYFYAKNTKYNRTIKTIEAGFQNKVALTKEKFKIHIEGLQYYHNEYRTTPLVFDFNFCEALEENLFGVAKIMTEYGNLTKCPIQKGKYFVRNFYINGSYLFPHAPRGRWSILATAYISDHPVITTKWFISIEDIVKIRN